MNEYFAYSSVKIDQYVSDLKSGNPLALSSFKVIPHSLLIDTLKRPYKQTIEKNRWRNSSKSVPKRDNIYQLNVVTNTCTHRE